MNRKIKIVAAVTFINVALYTAPCHAFLWPTFDIAEVLNTISGYMTKAKSTASTVKSTMSVGKIQQAIGDNVGSLSKFVDVKEKAEKQQKKLEKQKRRAERLAKLRKKWEDAQKMIDKIKKPYSQLRNYADEYYGDGKELFEQGQKYYQEGQKQYDSAKKDYENAKKEYESLKQQYEKATDAERAGIQGKYVEAMQKYNEAKDKFDDISLSYTPETVSAEEDFSDEDFGLEDEDFGFDEIEEEIPEPTSGVAENNGGLAQNAESAQSSGSNVSSVFEESPVVKVAPSFDGDDGSDIIVKDNPRQFKRAVAPLNKAEKVSAVFTSASRPQAFAQLGKNVLAEKNKEFKSGTNADGKFIYSDEIATKCDMEVEDLTAEKVSECVKSWVLDLHDPNAEIAAEWQRLYKRAKHDHVANDLAVALTHKNYSANFGKVNEDLEKKSEALTNEREEVSFSGTVALTNQEIIIRLMEAMTGQITTEAVNSIGMLERDYYDDEDKDDGNE